MPDTSSPFRRARLILWGILFAMGVGVLAYQLWLINRPVPAVPTAQEALRASITPEFTLLNAQGGTVTADSFKGKWMMIFFGYTHCPDVCPTTLNTVAETLAELGEAAAQVQPLFISVDPQRDTAQQLADYTAAFDPRILGLTGSEDQIKAASRAFKVYFRKVPEKDGGPDDYSVDHTAFLYLVNPEGDMDAVFSFHDEVDKVVAEMKRRLGQTP